MQSDCGRESTEKLLIRFEASLWSEEGGERDLHGRDIPHPPEEPLPQSDRPVGPGRGWRLAFACGLLSCAGCFLGEIVTHLFCISAAWFGHKQQIHNYCVRFLVNVAPQNKNTTLLKSTLWMFVESKCQSIFIGEVDSYLLGAVF